MLFQTDKRHTHTLPLVLNVSLSIRANGTEHLYFLIRELKLSYLNVSPSIVAAHHFHSNPPQRNELELLSLSPFFSPAAPPHSLPLPFHHHHHHRHNDAPIRVSTLDALEWFCHLAHRVTILTRPLHDFCFETDLGAITALCTHTHTYKKKKRLSRRAENCCSPSTDGLAFA